LGISDIAEMILSGRDAKIDPLEYLDGAELGLVALPLTFSSLMILGFVQPCEGLAA
jgi:hypothetical protein